MMEIINNKEKKKRLHIVVNFKFLRKYYKKFINNLRVEGNYKGDVVIITSKLTPVFLFKSSNFKNIHF